MASIADITAATEFVQVAGFLYFSDFGKRQIKRLVTTLKDSSGAYSWSGFRNFLDGKNLNPGFRYRAFGKIGVYNGALQLTHPEIEGF